MIKNLLSNLLHLVPRELRYEICRHHANKEFAENRSDFKTNGELWVLQNLIRNCKTVFDVGSFTGGWAHHALLINPGLDVHCFEPSRQAFQILQNNVFAENVTCNPFGLGSENSSKTLFVNNQLNEGDSLYRRQGIEYFVGDDLQISTDQVEIRTLDSYCSEKKIHEIDFLKIDVEGHEFAVIQGGKELFASECIKIVQFEYGGTYIDSRILLRDFFDFFEGLNYKFYLLYPNRVGLISHYDQRLENFQYKNFLIVNNDVLDDIRIFKKKNKRIFRG
jgi:FkbM family methyltransferase